MTKAFDVALWDWDGPHIRVFSSSGSTVTERGYDPSHWFTGGFSAAGKGVSATARKGKGEQERVSVYTVGVDNNITEQCWDGDTRKWTPGRFQATGVDVAAVSWWTSGSHRIRVYVLDTNKKVTEHSWDGDNWVPGDFVAENAAGVEATAWTVGGGGGFSVKDKSIRLRIYVRGTDNKITEYYYDDDKWIKGAFSAQDIKDISVAAYVKGEANSHLRAYTINTNRQLVEHCWDGDNWYTGSLSLGGVDAVSAIAWTSSGGGPFDTEKTHLRVYTKGSDNRIVERYWDGEWNDGEFTPA